MLTLYDGDSMLIDRMRNKRIRMLPINRIPINLILVNRRILINRILMDRVLINRILVNLLNRILMDRVRINRILINRTLTWINRILVNLIDRILMDRVWINRILINRTLINWRILINRILINSRRMLINMPQGLDFGFSTIPWTCSSYAFLFLPSDLYDKHFRIVLIAFRWFSASTRRIAEFEVDQGWESWGRTILRCPRLTILCSTL